MVALWFTTKGDKLCQMLKTVLFGQWSTLKDLLLGSGFFNENENVSLENKTFKTKLQCYLCRNRRITWDLKILQIK